MTREEIVKFLRENLTIEIDKGDGVDYYDRYSRKVVVSILIEGDVIDSDYIAITEGEGEKGW